MHAQVAGDQSDKAVSEGGLSDARKLGLVRGPSWRLGGYQ